MNVNPNKSRIIEININELRPDLIGIKKEREEQSFDCDSKESQSDQNENYKTGRWHPNEHTRFIKGCLLYGNNWKKVKICFILIFFCDFQTFECFFDFFFNFI